MSKKAYKLLPIILILAIGILTIRLFVVLLPAKTQKADTKKGVEYIQSLEAVDPNTADNTVRKAQEKYAGADQRKKIQKAIKNGNYNYAFKDIIISGDSIVKAIWEYGVLDKTHVIAEIGGGTAYLNDVTDTIVAANPKYLVLHYGENQLSSKSQAENFTNAYAKCIKKLQKKLPHTEIYVDSIFPVKKFAYKSDSYLKNIDYYNEYIEEMAKELGVHYIDYTPIWASYKKNYYDADGIHPIKSYYTEQYLPQILTEVGYKVD